jgi:hypothetical protein
MPLIFHISWKIFSYKHLRQFKNLYILEILSQYIQILLAFEDELNVIFNFIPSHCPGFVIIFKFKIMAFLFPLTYTKNVGSNKV